MLFLAGADHERYGKVKWTRRYLLGHRRILKKGDFTTPPVDPIFQKENGGLKYDISKPPLDFSTQNRHRMAVSCVRIYTLNSYLSLE